MVHIINTDEKYQESVLNNKRIEGAYKNKKSQIFEFAVG